MIRMINLQSLRVSDRIILSRIIKPIEYTIRFQNTGNDNAERVRVVDRLDQGLDVHSFELIGSSHPMNYSIRDGVIEFVFDNINLPYAGMDEKGIKWICKF
jgi:hypothetical protein